VAFVVVVLRAATPALAGFRPALARRLLSVGQWIFIRTAALMSSFVLAGAVATRFGDDAVGAHQIAFQLWIFLALVLDAVAIAGQIIVGGELGGGRAERAYEASERMIWLSAALGAVFAAVLVAGAGVIPHVFTSDGATIDEAGALWPLFALTLPFAGAVFARDGILIGAGDGPYLAASMLAAFAACAVALGIALAADWGVRGVWAAIVLLILVRLAAMGARFRRRRWLVTGWA
jgi:Na+-driven multidrug efflux pump